MAKRLDLNAFARLTEKERAAEVLRLAGNGRNSTRYLRAAINGERGHVAPSAGIFREHDPRHFCEDLHAVLLARFPTGRIKLDLPIVTAADAAYFVAVQTLFASLTIGHRCEFILVDLGLTPEQRAWCRRHFIDLRRPPRLVIPKTTHGWQTWNKPFYLAAVDVGPLLWLDADTMVVGPIDWLQDAVATRPFVCHCFAACGFGGYRRGMRSLANRPQLYERYPVPRRMMIDRPNAGVLALNCERDAELLDAWRSMVRDAATDHDVAGWLSWWDQGALQWAMEKLGMVNLVTHEQRFNDPLSLQPQPHWTPEEFVAAVESLSPQTRILHFPARQKPYARFPRGMEWECLG